MNIGDDCEHCGKTECFCSFIFDENDADALYWWDSVINKRIKPEEPQKRKNQVTIEKL